VVPKVRRPAQFAGTVAGYGILPRRLVPAATLGLIAVESFLAVAFLSGWMTAIALPLAIVMVVVFAAGVTVNLRRGRRIACGCFGSDGEPISARSLARLSVMLAAVAVLAAMPASTVTVATLADRGASGAAYLVQVGGTTCFLLLAATWALNLPEVVSTLKRSGIGAG
jgi:hypothetical protein